MQRLRVVALDAFRRAAPMRIPFRFGTVTLSTLHVAYLRVEIETADGARGVGSGAAVLSPLWFDRRAGVEPARKEHGLLRSIALAVGAARAAPASTAYALHRACEEHARAHRRRRGAARGPLRVRRAARAARGSAHPHRSAPHRRSRAPWRASP